MLRILVISDGWGSEYGGINSFNYEFCKALSQNKTVNVTCVIPYLNPSIIPESNLHILGLYSNPDKKQFDEGWEFILFNKLKASGEKIDTFDLCIGHDVITGFQALDLKKYHSNLKIVIFSHQAYELYTSLKRDNGKDAINKSQTQLDLYSKSDILLCVGPLLYEHFYGKDELCKHRDERRLYRFIPGIPNIPKSSACLKSFSLMTMGRYEPRDGDIKGIDLTIEGFSKALYESEWSFGDSPTIKIFGLSEDQQICKEQSQHIKDLTSSSNKYVSTNSTPFTTNRNILLRELRNSSCLSMLSIQEGFGLVGWEGIASEIPVLISQNSGLFRLLKSESLDNLVSSLSIQGTKSDINAVKEKMKEIASQIEDKKNDAKLLLKLLTDKYNWGNVISDFLHNIESILKFNDPIKMRLNEVKNDVANNGYNLLQNFYASIQNRNFLFAWHCLSTDFQQRRWSDFEEFEEGYSTMVKIDRVKIFESVKGFSTSEYLIYYEDTEEVPIKPFIDVKYLCTNNVVNLVTEVDKLRDNLVSYYGIEQNDFDSIPLSYLFSENIDNLLMFKFKLFGKIPRHERKFQITTKLYRCYLIIENKNWKIDRILPVRFSSTI